MRKIRSWKVCNMSMITWPRKGKGGILAQAILRESG